MQRGLMSNSETVRDAGTCLGGFLGMFLGAMLGFAFCMKYVVDRVDRNDDTVHSSQALLPFLGIMASACIGALAGAVLFRLVIGVFALGRTKDSK
jgi:hypothetical protein